MGELKFKERTTKATYKFFKTICLLRLGKLQHLLWNTYPTMDFVERNHD